MKIIASKFRSTILILILLFCYAHFTVAQVTNNVSSNFPSEEEALASAKSTVAAYEKGDWEALKSHLTPDATFYNLGSYDSLTVEQTVAYWKKGRESATPALDDNGLWLTVSVSTGPAQGNWVLHWGNNTLSYPNGESITFPYHVAMKMKDSKVSEVHFYYDNHKIIRELGYEIQPPLKDDQDND